MCIHKPSPPSLIYCICAPSHVDFGYAFSPATYLGHLLLHVGTSRTPRISYFPYSFAGRRHIWVAFYLMSKVGRRPATLVHSDLFSDASTLTNRPQICRTQVWNLSSGFQFVLKYYDTYTIFSITLVTDFKLLTGLYLDLLYFDPLRL